MRDYLYNYRSLDGWECFEAEGKFCHHRNHENLIRITGSSNYGHGICCKPNYKGKYCNDKGVLICSQPVSYLDTSPEYLEVLTDGEKNHQMFSFLPKTNPVTCGISKVDYKGEMKLTATNITQTISLVGLKSLKYKEGSPKEREYDACYYEISAVKP